MSILQEVSPADDRTGFEILLSEMILTFVRITGDEVDEEIDRWLERIGLRLGLDGITVAEICIESGTAPMTHCWADVGLRPAPLGTNAIDSVPWLARHFMAGETASFTSADELPPEAEADVEFVSPFGVQSILTIPMRVGGNVIGAVAFASIKRKRIWTDPIRRRLELVSELLACALERKREIASLRNLEKQLYRVSSAAMLGEITASLVHELNQPMTAILSNAQAASRMTAAENLNVRELREALDDIARDDRRAVDIIRWVRALFSGGSSEKSSAQLEDILTDVQRIMKRDALARGIAFRREVTHPLPVLMANRAQLTQALINLVMNGFDAAADNDHSPREVAIAARSAGDDEISISVRDSGKGIEPGLAPKLFDTFFTTKANGMGMGLAIARTIVENHGGRIRAFRNHDRGSTFEIVLPVAEPAAADL